MKFSLSWLRDHLDTNASLDRISTTLSSIGLEVESIDNPAAKLVPFRTARVISATQHPNADRLRVCQVDIGEAVPVSVVCGAPNARTGMHAVFAPPGAHIPGSNITLKVGEIRGVTSAGMLVSFRELGLGEDHDGIIELPDDAPIGQAYASWAGLDDPIIDIGVTPNRGDALSIRGIARDLAAAGLGTLKPWSAPPVPAEFEAPLSWQIDWPDACPWILGRGFRGLRNGPSPDWLRRRLTAIGLRPISALVDITNYFTYTLGRPLHVFDADAVAGQRLTLRRGAGESFAALNGRDITVTTDDLVIADANGVISLAGIIGGAATGSQAETTNAFLECALFDPVIIARAGRRHQISTDARQRFERGIDPSLLPAAIEAASAMILELCGGEAGSIVTAGAEPAWQRNATLRFERLSGLGGSDIGAQDAADILARLGFEVRSQDHTRITVAVPPWRNDVAARSSLDQPAGMDPERTRMAAEGAALIEPECDLLEEVLRIRGLDHIPSLSLPCPTIVPAPCLTRRQSRTALSRRLLATRGLAECVTYSFLDKPIAARFGEAPDSLTLKNPIASDLDQMRPTPLATLAQAAARNIARGAGSVGFFEIGPAYTETAQVLVAAGLRVGPLPRHWVQAASEPGAFAAKADVWAMLAALSVPMEALTITPDAPAHYHPGQSGTVRQGPKTILATFGTLHPALVDSLALAQPAAAFELFLDAVADPKRRRRAPPVLPSLQPISRDFAFVVPIATQAETVLRAARQADRALVAKVSLFDIYQGDTVTIGHKSLGVEVVFQPTERSLTDQEIEAASRKVVEAVAKASGAHLR